MLIVHSVVLRTLFMILTVTKSNQKYLASFFATKIHITYVFPHPLFY